LLEAFLDDKPAGVLHALRSVDSPNFIFAVKKCALPRFLRSDPQPAMVAAWLGAVECVKLFINLSFDHRLLDAWQRSIAHYAVASGSFDICRELDNLGVDFSARDAHGFTPAYVAAEFGQQDILMWLWIRGVLTSEVGWKRTASGDPDVVVVAAGGGHTKVVELLLTEFGLGFARAGVLRFNGRRASKEVRTALAGDRGVDSLEAAARGGRDETVGVLLGLGARTAGMGAIRAAIASGSWPTLKHLLAAAPKKRNAAVWNDSTLLIDAAGSGHADLLRSVLEFVGATEGVDEALAFAVLRGFTASEKLLRAHGGTFVWTSELVKEVSEHKVGALGELLTRLPPLTPDCAVFPWRPLVLLAFLRRDLAGGVCSREVVEAVLRERAETFWPNCTGEKALWTLERMGTLGPRASEVFTARNAHLLHSRGMRVIRPLRKVLGERWEGLDFGLLPQNADWRNETLIALVRLGMPVVPGRRPDGHEYLPLIDRTPWIDVETVNALAEAGVDFSHHSHLGLGECHHTSVGAICAYERERAAVDRMVELGAVELPTPPERQRRRDWHFGESLTLLVMPW
jgi:hypothetical protein